MSRTPATLAALALAATLAGCSSSDADTPAEPAAAASSSAPAAAPATTAPKSSSLDIPAAIGETTGMKNDTLDVFTVALTRAEADGQCPDPTYTAPENGHLLLVDVDLATGPDYSPADFPNLLSPFQDGWTIVGADGVTETDISTVAAYSCANSTEYPDHLNPNARYRFTLAFDTANPTGTLAYELRAGASRVGWNWRY